MSFWYDVKNKNYSSSGKESWIKAYADRIVSVLRKETETKFSSHFSGNLGRHKASDVECNGGMSVQSALNTETEDRMSADAELISQIESEMAMRQSEVNSLNERITAEEENRWSSDNSLSSEISSKAPSNHASQSTTYGEGTSTYYGHVKVANDLITNATKGVALSANQGRVLKNSIDALPIKKMTGSYEIKPDGTTASGTTGVVIGDMRDRAWINGFNWTEGNVATGKYALATGNGTTASGEFSSTFGNSVTASGSKSVACGFMNTASGSDVFVAGGFNTGKNRQVKIGWCAKEGSGSNFNSTTGDAFVIGNGTFDIDQPDGSADYGNATITPSNAFRVTYGGEVYGGGAYNSSGADIAELYEWQDGNPDGEDRRGLFVTLDGTKIKLANTDDTYIKGVISARPCLVGDSASEDWHGKYMTDVFGELLTQTVHHDAVYKDVEKINPETGEKTVEKELICEEYDSVEFILNPEYNVNEEYIPREERPEYDYVSSWGKIVLVDDGSCKINGFAKPGDMGKATNSEEKTSYRVMKRIDDNHILVAVG